MYNIQILNLKSFPEQTPAGKRFALLPVLSPACYKRKGQKQLPSSNIPSQTGGDQVVSTKEQPRDKLHPYIHRPIHDLAALNTKNLK